MKSIYPHEKCIGICIKPSKYADMCSGAIDVWELYLKLKNSTTLKVTFVCPMH